MSPHYDTMDGPVVSAAKRALETGNINLVLPWVPASAEVDLRKSFDRAVKDRGRGKEAKEVSDLWFFETVVRLHLQGEGIPFTGLKPAGVDVGPVIGKAQHAIQDENPDLLIRFLQNALEDQVMIRYKEVVAHKGFDPEDTQAAREYVRALLELTEYSHRIFEQMTALTGKESIALWEHPVTIGESQPIPMGARRTVETHSGK